MDPIRALQDLSDDISMYLIGRGYRGPGRGRGPGLAKPIP